MTLLMWVPGNSYIEGNEKEDELAGEETVRHKGCRTRGTN